MGPPRKILILGASYGSLLATKLLLAGQTVSLVCRSHEADLINSEGTLVRIPLKRRAGLIEIDSRRLPGKLDATTPEAADPNRYDLVCLAMQEPQYRSAEVRELMSRIAASGKPIMSIMNMPPLPFLARIPALDLNALEFCYADARVWDGFAPGLFTLASSDPQAFRPPGGPPNILQVTLATNFKVARFEDAAQTAMLLELGSAIETARFDLGYGSSSEVPVKVKVHDSVFVPLAKWSMLLTGNYRCIEAEGIRSIREVVHSDLAASRDIYDWVGSVLRAIGAHDADVVPFDDYAAAALSLTEPSSIARALVTGATEIERVDLLVQNIAALKGMRNQTVDATAELVDLWLLRHRGGARGV
jgi:hypothetical protein